MIYITGDTHGIWSRFSTPNFPEGKNLTKEDFVIVCGDFGIWDNSKEEKYWLDWLDKKPWTTLFIDGNHENFDIINSFPIEEWNGGCVHKIRPSVIHLMRGYIFNLCGYTFFAFGGAKSHDIQDGILEAGDPRIKQWKYDSSKLFRINHISWWKEEMPNDIEKDRGISTLEKANWNVDYILTHEYTADWAGMRYSGKRNDFQLYLQNIKNNTKYRKWFFGHYHTDEIFYYDKAQCFYTNIERII